MFNDNQSNQNQPVIVNGFNSPVRISIDQGIAKESKKPYDYMNLVIGEWEQRIFFKSPLERKELERVLAIINKGNAHLND